MRTAVAFLALATFLTFADVEVSAQTPITYYTRAEVAQHNKNDDIWLIVHNNVYDITRFVNEHPAGDEVLLAQAGKDATDFFDDVGHSNDAKDAALTYKIGEIVQSERS